MCYESTQVKQEQAKNDCLLGVSQVAGRYEILVIGKDGD